MWYRQYIAECRSCFFYLKGQCSVIPNILSIHLLFSPFIDPIIVGGRLVHKSRFWVCSTTVSAKRKRAKVRLVSLAEFHIKRSHFGDNFCNRCQSNCQNTFRSSWNRLQWFSNGGVNYTNLNFYSGCCTGQHLPKMWQIGRKSGVTEKAVFRETGDQNL